jgi:hypothetical protein
MAIQITNNAYTIDIDFTGNGDQYSIHKINITLEKSGDTVVIVDSGRVPAKEYKILYTDVIPKYNNANELYDKVLEYINDNQIEEEINEDSIIHDRNTNVLNTLVELQMETNKILRKIYNPK